MDERRSFWQQKYENARPAGVVLWCATHRQLVRVAFGIMIALAVGLLVWAVLEGESVVSPILNIVTFSTQLVLWGFSFPRQVDEWQARQAVQGDLQGL